MIIIVQSNFTMVIMVEMMAKKYQKKSTNGMKLKAKKGQKEWPEIVEEI